MRLGCAIFFFFFLQWKKRHSSARCYSLQGLSAIAWNIFGDCINSGASIVSEWMLWVKVLSCSTCSWYCNAPLWVWLGSNEHGLEAVLWVKKQDHMQAPAWSDSVTRPYATADLVPYSLHQQRTHAEWFSQSRWLELLPHSGINRI